jgi:hypothetical protein
MRPIVRVHSPRRTCAAVRGLIAAVLVLACGGRGRCGTVTFTESGISGAGNPITVSATLVTSGTTLSIALSNIGPKTKVGADVLTSFYFGIADPNGGVRPTLTYLSASGTACQVFAGDGNDRFVSWQTTPLQQLYTTGTAALAPSNLVASVNGDSGWQFKAFDNVAPQLGFGIGTVGNSNIATIGGPAYAGLTFDPEIVSQSGPPGRTMINLGIYSNGSQPLPGDIDARGEINGATLVNTRALFLFGSSRNLDSFGQTWVQGNVTFGFGTGPSTVLLPEPGGMAMAAAAAASGLAWWICRRRRRPPAA